MEFLDPETYDFKHYKNDIYCLEYLEKQIKKNDYQIYYYFNANNLKNFSFISSIYPIL